MKIDMKIIMENKCINKHDFWLCYLRLSQCEKTQDTVKENWSEKMLPNYQILC